MKQEEKIFRHINKNGYGIEVGPSHNPLAPKKKGYKVHVIDHLNKEQLIKKYEHHGVNLDNIEEVDFVWQGEDFSELTGKTKYYDWIIASHLIEHTPDFIGFLNNCDKVLKDDGVISLVVPDKRYCFDHFRPVTGLSKIIDSHSQKNKIHTPGTVAEYFLNVVAKNKQIAWSTYNSGDYNLIHSLEEAQDGMHAVINNKTYIDMHSWCFVPHSFRLIIHDLFSLGLIPLQEVDFFPTVGSEFYITLSRSGKGINKSRLEMLSIIESEIKEEASFFTKNKNFAKHLIGKYLLAPLRR
ncbi:hypothetical protein LPTSP3_g07490 [Leptospira kobayashii]|uniref:Uncharacterized protein n=1 Tax=Leptospira kobayashii TaxID=1917830 RepID=A0ABN6KDS1_9LEPT|nr:class I SAM-dependent methyltransferase [Leptospira kobayashii]BDA77819.1 hypothetical protein LPTSP3_g07490 [Leptospira kobayashii]